VSFLGRFLGRREIALSAAHRTRLEHWRIQSSETRRSVGDARFVVIDVETSGLDPRVDRLIAIGAVTAEVGKIDLGNAFYAVLRQPESSSRDNILVHGIGETMQREGVEPAEALLAFLEFAGKSPLVGYHAAFDSAVIRRAMSEYLGEAFRARWIDLAQLAPHLLPQDAARCRALDDWLNLFHIEVFRRHDAIADALATAQLLLALMARMPQRAATPVASILWHPRAGRARGGW
jgi:DNA polymerase-3 subunit epsilon